MEMVKLLKTNTFQAIRLYKKVKKQSNCALSWDSLHLTEPQTMHTPLCMHLLLWGSSGDKQLRLVNKHYGMALSVQHKRILCCSAKRMFEQLFDASVNLDTTMASFSPRCMPDCKLGAVDGMVTLGMSECQWKIKAADERHVKIFTKNGNDELLYRLKCLYSALISI